MSSTTIKSFSSLWLAETTLGVAYLSPDRAAVGGPASISAWRRLLYDSWLPHAVARWSESFGDSPAKCALYEQWPESCEPKTLLV